MADKEKKPAAKVNQGGKKVKPSKMAYDNEKRDVKNKAKKVARHKKVLAWQAKRKKINEENGYVLPSYIKRLKRREEKRKGAKAKAKEVETAKVETVAEVSAA